MTTFQVWIRLPNGAVEHTTLRGDEWLTIEVDRHDVDAAIEEAGWCGTFGVLSGNRVVLQAGDESTIRTEALAYLKQA